MVKCLDKLSGDVNDLFLFLENNEINMLWEEEDDETLLNKHSKEVERKLLEKAKGRDSITKRLDYYS